MRKLNRGHIVFAWDVVVAAVSLPFALMLRVGSDIFFLDPGTLLTATAVFALVAGAVFWYRRLYAGVWRYASLNDLRAIAMAATLAVLLNLPILFAMDRLEWLPRSIPVLHWFVLVVLLTVPRITYRMYKDWRTGLSFENQAQPSVNVLLIGAGEEAEMFINFCKMRRQAAAYKPVGLVDEKGARIGRNIHGVHVLGDIESIPSLMEQLTRARRRPLRFILTKDTVDGALVRRLLEIADQCGVTLVRLPQLTEFKTGTAADITVRPIAIEDILSRPQTVLDRAAMRGLIAGKRVLVTGAGGTIGSELVRQVADYGPAAIALLDSSEHHLYLIDLEMREKHPELPRAALLADVRDHHRIERVMASEKPDLVFHAAALKHVPVAEAHPDEAVLTNVIGTRNVADACRANGIAAMVLISTDKAVNPSSIMGATKRLAEAYCQSLDVRDAGARGRAPTRYVTVRFGNVLGSTGSVVPLFQRQLAAGGPITVTHPDMKRYFMTVREAVELVLEASALGTRTSEAGKIYVLDMGEPVKILDLARRMILLSGKRPDADVKIVFTGMRPGEKLFEEILHGAEPTMPTEYPGILVAAPRAADHALIARAIEELAVAGRAGNCGELPELIGRYVPEFEPPSAAEIRAAAGS
jgi:O-antigen biosynthesis protein WbqV